MAKKKIPPELREKLHKMEQDLREIQRMVQVVADEFERRAAKS